jgi:Swi5-dependent recombination DNA repair protein 1
MGGPRAWKELQKKQQEFQNSWPEEELSTKNLDDENGQGKDAEKRDVYAEHNIEPETENEKSQRVKGASDTGELPGQEDVCPLHRVPGNIY